MKVISPYGCLFLCNKKKENLILFNVSTLNRSHNIRKTMKDNILMSPSQSVNKIIKLI